MSGNDVLAPPTHKAPHPRAPGNGACEKTLLLTTRFGFIRACAGRTWLEKSVLSQPAENVTLPTARAMNRSRMRILYSGHVQGIGFRYTAKSVAAGFEVTGTVRNLLDGRVELVAEGPREELLAFQKAISDAGLGHFVKNEEVSWKEATGEFGGFEIAGY